MDILSDSLLLISVEIVKLLNLLPKIILVINCIQNHNKLSLVEHDLLILIHF